MQYYDVQKNWRKIRPFLEDEEFLDLLIEDFDRYTWGRIKEHFEYGMMPHDFESCDWWLDHRGRRPAFWDYVKHAASHWLVNKDLRLAMLVEPKRPWRIITSEEHSTVWDGGDLIFSMNFQALGVDVKEGFDMANKFEFEPGEYMEVGEPLHYSEAYPKAKSDDIPPPTPQGN